MTKKPKQRGSIRITILLMSVFGGLTALAVGLVLLISTYTSFTDTRALMRSRAKLTIDALERDIGQHLAPALSIVRHVGSLVENDDLDITDKQALIQTLKGTLAAATQINGVVVWNKDLHQLRITQYGDAPPEITSLYTPEDKDTATFLNSIRKRGKPVWTPPYREAGKTYMLVFAPLFRKTEYLGTIATGVSVSELSSFVLTLGDELKMTAFILYGDNHILAHPDLADKKSRKLYETGEALLNLEKLADPVLQNLKNALPRQIPGKYNFTSYRVNVGTDKALVFSRTVQSYGQTPWRIGIYGPLAELTSEIGRLKNSFLIGVFLLVLAVLAAVFLARRIAAPIKKTAEAALKIGKFDLEEIVPLKSSRITELNNQARAFNQMLDGLKSFQTYVPQRLVKRLISEDSGHGAASREAELTVMFTDIVGFTAMSERLSPADTADMLNIHFEVINACIEESGGTLDKYIGDAAMAFWGAPEKQDDHARRAARAALCIARRMENHPTDPRWPDLRIKIAIHTGPLIVGNIGAKSRMNYTIIGDTVNTCSRIENLCGELDDGARVNILLSDETAKLIDEFFEVTRVGEFQVKGRNRSVKLWRLAGKTHNHKNRKRDQSISS